MPKKILVLDYDNCIAGFTGSKRKDGLMQSFIDYAKSHEFEGFYGCTARNQVNSRFGIISKYYLYYHHEHLDTVRDILPIDAITKNFKKASGLPCLGVSIPENEFTDLDNAPVSQLIQYERDILEECFEAWPAGVNYLYLKKCLVDEEKAFCQKMANVSTQEAKNKQLMTVIRHAQKRYPNEPLILEFYDDCYHNCWQTFRLMQRGFPEGVTLKVYHVAAGDLSQGKLTLGSVEPLRTLPKVPSQDNGQAVSLIRKTTSYKSLTALSLMATQPPRKKQSVEATPLQSCSKEAESLGSQSQESTSLSPRL